MRRHVIWEEQGCQEPHQDAFQASFSIPLVVRMMRLSDFDECTQIKSVIVAFATPAWR